MSESVAPPASGRNRAIENNPPPVGAATESFCPELLAPAGDWECARAAVENGADAIYFGVERFNARMRARNFTLADLPRLMEFLHGRGVRGFVTFNTLVFANEMEAATDALRSIIAAGVDAAIVQDVGVCRLIRRLSPDFPIHASTQMTVTSAEGVRFARELGCQLVVLARECSIKEIEKIQAAQTGAGAEAGSLPLEVFVHGALCVAYSGQCLTSEALGGRSANRGECAQACRMPYELVSDGQTVPLGDRRYLLSPQDLAGLEVLPELIRLRLASLKIEGRLKTPEYVANITKVYRRALDQLASPAAPPAGQIAADSRYDLEMGFSRGLFTGWFRGNDNQALVHARFGKKRGVYLGQVKRLRGAKVLLDLVAPLKPGDGVVFDAGQPDLPEEGGRIYEIQTTGVESLLGFGSGDIDFSRVHPGDRLWKTSDPELDRRLRRTFAGETPGYQRPLHLEVHGRAGFPLVLLARDEIGHAAKAGSAQALVAAETQPLSEARLREQLGRLGGTPFRLGRLENFLEGPVLLPVSELNRMRREIVAELDRLRKQPLRWQLHSTTPEITANQPLSSPPAPVSDPTTGARVRDPQRAACNQTPGGSDSPLVTRHSSPVTSPSPLVTPNLIVLSRNLAQLQAALDCGTTTLYCDFEDPKKYRDAVRLVREFGGCSDVPRTVWIAPPRIFKMGEDWILKLVRSCDADGLLVRNYDHLACFPDVRRVGDFSLNVANPLTAEYFKNHCGLERLTASYDLNITQLEALLDSAPPSWFEITIHQHIPMFHMEHCVFCAFLSKGTDFTNCGRPCDRHQVRLRDRVGAEHSLKADAGCRNTVFNARAQTGAESVHRLLQKGARHFRLEFVDESPELVRQTIGRYRQLLRGEISGSDLWRELKLMNQLGVTRGQMETAER
jgi:putative protease